VTSPLPAAPRPEVLSLELQAVEAVSADLRRAVQRAARLITQLYMQLAGGLGQPLPPERRQIFVGGAAQIIDQIQFQGRDTLWQLVHAALAIGTANSTAQALVAASVLRTDTETWIGNLVGTIVERVLAALLGAKGHLQTGKPIENYSDVILLIGLVNRAQTLVERDTRWAVNGAYNQGVLVATTEDQVARVWVAEEDACLHCLAYSGEVAGPGQPYRAGLTFYIDPNGNYKPLSQMPVWGPPLHPNCRCSQEPFLGSFEYPVMSWETRETSVADALKREAKRTVLKGDSGTDSQPARLRAVSALLAHGAGLPKSVEAKARAAVRAGAFK
jgi:hypothetical protein